MAMDRTEFCTRCGDPTGRAGNFHDSIFVQMPDQENPLGPLCDDCKDSLVADGGESIEEDYIL